MGSALSETGRLFQQFTPQQLIVSQVKSFSRSSFLLVVDSIYFTVKLIESVEKIRRKLTIRGKLSSVFGLIAYPFPC